MNLIPLILLTSIFFATHSEPKYCGVFVTMDGCEPCERLKAEIDKKVLSSLHYVNIDHFDKESDYYNIKKNYLKGCISLYEVRICPTVLIFKKESDKVTYIGKIEGYMSKDEFSNGVKIIKELKYGNEITIRKNSKTYEPEIVSGILDGPK